MYFKSLRSTKGEQGKWAAKREPSIKDAEKTFKKTFREKTDNGWNMRDDFTPHPEKYYIKNLSKFIYLFFFSFAFLF